LTPNIKKSIFLGNSAKKMRYDFELCYNRNVLPKKEVSMWLTVLEIEVGNPSNPEIKEKIEFLIDSGAIYSVVPAPVLERLGIRPLAEQEFRLANGTKIVRKKGGALFKYGDRIGVADVIFGEEGDSVLLGAFTLEALGLSLDPLRRELKPLPMILAGEG
jgi:clan AA aspartic protease